MGCRTARLAVKAASQRNPDSKSVLRVVDARVIGGDFLFLSLAPLPNKKAIFYHEWGGGGMTSEVELIGFPGGGSYKVMRRCETPLGLIRTAERGIDAMAVPGEVPGPPTPPLHAGIALDLSGVGVSGFGFRCKHYNAAIHSSPDQNTNIMPERSLPNPPPQGVRQLTVAHCPLTMDD